jgi:hypothetical protein
MWIINENENNVTNIRKTDSMKNNKLVILSVNKYNSNENEK